MNPMYSKPSGVKIWCLGCLLVVVGVFLFHLLRSSTREFWDIVAFGFIIFGVLLVGITVLAVTVVVLVAGWVVERRNLSIATQRLILLTPWILAATIWIVLAVISATPRSRFASMVVCPVPGSVQDIKVAGLNSFLARRWLFSFTIDRGQVGDIVRKHALIQTNSLDFQKIIDGDTFLKRVAWARNVSCNSNAIFYVRMDADTSWWTCLAVNTNTTRACFLTGYQN